MPALTVLDSCRVFFNLKLYTILGSLVNFLDLFQRNPIKFSKNLQLGFAFESLVLKRRMQGHSHNIAVSMNGNFFSKFMTASLAQAFCF
jgi:hypothetical protein